MLSKSALFLVYEKEVPGFFAMEKLVTKKALWYAHLLKSVAGATYPERLLHNVHTEREREAARQAIADNLAATRTNWRQTNQVREFTGLPDEPSRTWQVYMRPQWELPSCFVSPPAQMLDTVNNKMWDSMHACEVER